MCLLLHSWNAHCSQEPGAPSGSLLPRSRMLPLQPGLDQAEARSQGFHLGLPRGWGRDPRGITRNPDPKHSSVHLNQHPEGGCRCPQLPCATVPMAEEMT